MTWSSRRGNRRAWVTVAGLIALVGGCGGTLNRTGAESHFLAVCTTTAECDDGLDCIAGVCTRGCLMGENTCESLNSSARCTDQSIEPGQVAVCDVDCVRDADCARLGTSHQCVDGYCRSGSVVDGGVGGSGGSDSGLGTGGGGALVAKPSGAYELESADGFELVSGTTLVVSFNGTEFTFSGGCNGHFGSYSIEDDVLVIDGLGSTLIGCDEALEAQDWWVAEFVTNEPSISFDGMRVTLANPDASLVFLDDDVAHPDVSLTGQPFDIDTLIDGAMAMSVGDSSPSVEFGADGELTVDTGCNVGVGSYAVVLDTRDLYVDVTGYTELGCDTLEVEDHVKAVFAPGEVSVSIDGERLIVERGEIGLTATAR